MTGVPSPLDVHALLNEQDFVRRLARSLVFDQDQVDDVVQDAWVAALRRPPRRAAAVVGWFGSVLRNTAQRRARDAARRRTREVAAARPEALPSAADVLEREQLRRTVVDAVLALPEPYRGTVLARFFDELEPVEIARRRGVPAATVRSQLLRGLELLRERFDAQHGDRAAWCLAMVPLATPARAVGVGLGSMAGALLMAKLMAGVGALALTVLGVLWWADRDATPVAAIAARTDAPLVAPVAGGDANAAAGASSRAVIDTPATGGNGALAESDAAGLRGRVVRGDGSPAADVLVRVLGIDGMALFADADAQRGGLALHGGEARTATDGTFAIRGLPPRGHWLLQADADGDDRTLHSIDVMPQVGDVLDLGVVTLVGKGRVAGRIVDDAGQPIAGASVFALDIPAMVASMLLLDRFDPARGGVLAVPVPEASEEADAFAQRLHEYLGRSLNERDLRGERGLALQVVDRMPWLERVWNELPFARATTGVDGTFDLRAVQPGGNVLVVRSAGRAASQKANVMVRQAARTEVGDVALANGRELRGTVLAADGSPLAAAEVRVATYGVLGFRGIAFCAEPAHTDEHGAFACTGLPRGGAFVAVRASARAPWQTFGPFEDDDEPKLRLVAPVPLRLRLEGADGVAGANAAVELFAGPPLHELRRLGVQQRLLAATLPIDRDGVLAVGELPPGCYSLRLVAAGCAPVEVTATVPQTEPQLVRVAAVRALRVRVHDGKGAPVAGAKVYLDRHDGSGDTVLPSSYGLPGWSPLPESVGATDANGQLLVANAPSGSCYLHVRHPRYVRGWREAKQGSDDVDIELTTGGAIAGRLFDHGVPADPRRWCVQAEPQFAANGPLENVRALIAADGTFAFRALPATHYMVHVVPRSAETLSGKTLLEWATKFDRLDFGVAAASKREVVVAEGATVSCTLDVDPNAVVPGEGTAQLSGRVIENGVPRAGWRLQREAPEYTWNDLITAGADGSLAVTEIAAGKQHLRLQADGVTVWSGELQLAAGERRVLDFAWATGGVVGTAKFANGIAAAEHVVTAISKRAGGASYRHAKIDALGNFAFANLPVGDWEFSASGPIGECAAVPTTIAAGTPTPPLQLVLKDRLVLHCRVDLGTRTARNVMVNLQLGVTTMGRGPEDDEVHRFPQLEAEVYAITLTLDGKTVPCEPAAIDMRNGPVRDLVLRPVAPKAK